MSPLLNLSDADTTFTPIPAGTFRARVDSAEMRTTKGSAKLPPSPMAAFTLVISEDEPEREGMKVAGRKVFANYVLPEDPNYQHRNRMLGSFVNALVALGEKKDDVKSSKFKFDPEQYVGKVCQVIVSRDPDTAPDAEDGAMRNNVKRILPASQEQTAGRSARSIV